MAASRDRKIPNQANERTFRETLIYSSAFPPPLAGEEKPSLPDE